MYLADLQRRLVEVARRRVRSGAVTERGLARQCGVSQPHMHNVLKDIRALSPVAADRLMRALKVSVADLLWHSATEENPDVRGVPVIRHRIGPGIETRFGLYGGAIPLPASLVDGLIDPVAARLGPDMLLPAELAANDIVLLDQNPSLRTAPREGPWLIESEGGLRVRYARASAGTLLIGDRVTQARPRQWTAIVLDRHNILDIVKARVVWLSRELGREVLAGM